MKTGVLLLIVASALFPARANAQDVYDQNKPPPYITQNVVQQHCPNDTVVWFDSQTGLYYFGGPHGGSNVRSGAYATGGYMCLQNAINLGGRLGTYWQY